MAVFKCKMCGGSLEIRDETVAVCEYCGTRQTLPRSRDESLANLFNRANNLRIKCEFDKAQQLYEKILELDDTEAEAHWGVVLCKYGIEYVEDPKTLNRIPTCHRTSYQSIVGDPEYLAALEYADGAQRQVYQSEAEAIDGIQKNILQIVKNESPFDVFICYKESDASGNRTQDAVIANDVYYQLTQAGFKVFYAAITLEDKLGQEYEPYIFAALNSAKVMLVIGTKAEYFDAVWVKNEWSRFLNLMKTDRSKLLIPCYRDMDAYDLPGEFAHLQAQDMSKIGFINDITRGIKKVLQKEDSRAEISSHQTVVVNGGTGNVAPLLERAFMFLEDGDWTSADEYCEKVLDQDPKNARAYLGKLLAELHVSFKEGLADVPDPFDQNALYQKVLRFADEALSEEIRGYVTHIKERNKAALTEETYQNSLAGMDTAKKQYEFENLARAFRSLGDYKDSGSLRKECVKRAAIARKNETYQAACDLMNRGDVDSLNKAIPLFEEISDWKDSGEMIPLCRSRIEASLAEQARAREQARLREEERRRQAEEAKRKAEAQQAARKRKQVIKNVLKVLLILAVIAGVVGGIAYGVIYITKIAPQKKYEKGVAAFEAGEYDTAYGIFRDLNDYKDSREYAGKALYPMQAEILAQSDLQIGDSVCFGHYYQDSDDELQEIEWIVLARDGTRVQLCSKYILDNQAFHKELVDGITWADCSLREWLHSEFMDLAFSESHKAMITPTLVDGVTMDQLYLFTSEEVRAIFSEDDRNFVQVTAQAESGMTNQGYGNWWMRSVTDAGPEHMLAIDGYATPQSMTAASGVRPVMWIDLSLISLNSEPVSE